MDADDWEIELNRMIDVIGQQSAASFEKIHTRFNVLHRPFDAEFYQNALKMASLR